MAQATIAIITKHGNHTLNIAHQLNSIDRSPDILRLTAEQPLNRKLSPVLPPEIPHIVEGCSHMMMTVIAELA